MRGSLVAVVSCMTFACATAAWAQPLRVQRAGYEVEVLVDGVPAPTFSHAGGSYVLGQLGERYQLRVTNHTGRRIEAVVSIDGRDVIDGRPADYGKRGYLVPAWGSVDIDGWRVSTRQAAAFRFSSVPDSYAARTGSAREVGVIGVAVFPERVPVPPPYPYLPYSRDRREGAPAPAPSAEAGRGKSAEPSASAAAPRRARPGLGTEFGEEVSSPVREVSFVRASAGRPALVLGLRYDDRGGLLALGIDVDGRGWSDDDTALRQTATPFPVSTRGYAAPPPGWRGR
jgi:hypothetical protein